MSLLLLDIVRANFAGPLVIKAFTLSKLVIQPQVSVTPFCPVFSDLSVQAFEMPWLPKSGIEK